MTANKSRSGRTIKPVQRHDGELNMASKKKSTKAKPITRFSELEVNLADESSIKTSSECISLTLSKI